MFTGRIFFTTRLLFDGQFHFLPADSSVPEKLIFIFTLSYLVTDSVIYLDFEY